MLIGGMRAGPAALLIFYFVILFGVTFGASTGFDAENASQTEIYLEDETLVAGSNETNVSFDAENTSNSEPYEEAESSSPTLWAADRYEDEVPQLLPDYVHNTAQNATMAFAERMYWGAIQIMVYAADATATWTYHNRWWLPQWIVKGALQAATIVPMGVIAYSLLRRIQDLREQ